jgi:hypothetical protein
VGEVRVVVGLLMQRLLTCPLPPNPHPREMRLAISRLTEGARASIRCSPCVLLACPWSRCG